MNRSRYDSYDRPTGGGRYERGGYDDRRSSGRGSRPPGPPPEGGGPDFNFSSRTVAVLAGVLVVGIGIGSAVTSTTQGDQGNIASSQQLDMAVPDPEFCRQWGAGTGMQATEEHLCLHRLSARQTSGALRLSNRHLAKSLPHERDRRRHRGHHTGSGSVLSQLIG